MILYQGGILKYSQKNKSTSTHSVVYNIVISSVTPSCSAIITPIKVNGQQPIRSAIPMDGTIWRIVIMRL